MSSSYFKVQNYSANSLRGTGNERVLVVSLSSREHILNKEGNRLQTAISSAGLEQAVGIYFYRFADSSRPFMKIGECTRTKGISERIKRGWLSPISYSDSYRGKADKSSKFLAEVEKLSEEKRGYFVFYEHRAPYSHPKIDEIHAYADHKAHYGKGTLSPERINSNLNIGSELIFHKGAFKEVLNMEFPSGVAYGF